MYWRRFFLVKLPQIGVFILIIGIYIVNFFAVETSPDSLFLIVPYLDY